MNYFNVHFFSIFFLVITSITVCGQSNNNYSKINLLQKNIFEKHPCKAKINYHLKENIFSASAKQKKYNLEKFKKTNCTTQTIYRQIEGNCNNINKDTTSVWGSTHIPLKRFMPDVYNENSDITGANRNHPREISNAIFKAKNNIASNKLSSFVFTWGQFLDHDMILSPVDSEVTNIPVIPNDIIISPIPFNRSATIAGTGISGIARQQVNITTAWIDASHVYGADVELAHQLRTFENGKLKTSTAVNGESILPNIDGHFLAGDERALEQPGLTSLHILFVREHNRICDALLACGINNDEEIYQRARKKIGAIIQSITYNEFLPALGIQLPAYSGYDNTVQPDILNVFAAAAFRLGHTMVTDSLQFYNDEGELLQSLSLAEAFFEPSIIEENGIEIILNGLAQQFQQKVDAKVVESLRSFLFGAPPNAGFDLVALNIQRGRDHGLDDYNAYRAAFGISPAREFSDITSDTILQNNLKNIYNNNINDIDVWVGLLSEDHLPGASVGQTLNAMLTAQFTALRNGDFYFYKNDPALSENEKRNIDNTRLSDVIKRNTNIKNIKYDVFHGPCNEGSEFSDCVSDDITCNCTPVEICNYGICEQVIDIENCTCSVKVQMINEGNCAVVIYQLEQGKQKYVATIEPDTTFTFTSYKNVVLSMHTLNEPLNKQYHFVKECGKQTLNIDLQSCKENEDCLENSIEENEVNTIYRVNVFNQITATSIILKDAQAEYKAGNKIILKPGFKAVKGSYFNARIDQVCEENGGIEEDNNKLKINEIFSYSISPNPSNGTFTLKYQLAKKTNLSIAIYYATGKKLDSVTKKNQKAGSYNLSYNIQHFPIGIYYLTLSTADALHTQKLVIHR